MIDKTKDNEKIYNRTLSEEEINSNFKHQMSFPYGYNKLADQGFKDKDILEIRDILLKEIKRQNELA